MKTRAQNSEIAEAYQPGSGMSVLRYKRRLLLKKLFALPGRNMLNRILDLDDPRELIQELPLRRLFRLVKEVGEEDSLALLELASVD